MFCGRKRAFLEFHFPDTRFPDSKRFLSVGGNASLGFALWTFAASPRYVVNGSGINPADDNDFANGVLPAGTLNFTTSQTSQTLTILVRADRILEANEGFTVTLVNPLGATLATAIANGTILNDD